MPPFASALRGRGVTSRDENLGTQIRLRRQSLDINARSIMLRRFPKGSRECGGLLVGEASIGQATSNRVGIEHEVMLPRSYQAPGEGDERPSQVGPHRVHASVSGSPQMVRTVRWNPRQDVGTGGGNGRGQMT